MIAGWLVTGVSWGVMAASAVIVFMVVMGFAIGVLSFCRWIFKGGHGDEDANTEKPGGKDNDSSIGS